MIPSLSVVQTVPSRRRNDAPALSSPPNPIEPSTSPSTNHLKPDRDLDQPPAEVGDDAVDDRRRDERLADADVRAPAARAAEQVDDRGREDVVGVHQAGARDDDPVAVGVGVVAEREVEPVAQLDEPGHRERRRRVHPDLAVPVEGHEPERRVDGGVGDGQVEAVALPDRAPVVDGRAAQRVDADPQARRRRSPPCRRRCRGRRRSRPGSRARRPARGRARTARGRCRRGRPSPIASRIRFASSWIQRVTSVSAGPPLGGLYLKPPSSGGLCDGVTTMPSARPPPAGRPRLATRIACETAGVGRVAVGGVDADVDPVRDQHLERRPPRRLGERVGVAADEQRAGVALRGPVAADGLGRGQDVRLVERGPERRAAVAGGAERDPLGGIGRVGADVVVRARRGRRRRRGPSGGRAGRRAGWSLIGATIRRRRGDLGVCNAALSLRGRRRSVRCRAARQASTSYGARPSPSPVRRPDA